jgi:hypothetical protein
MTLSVGRKTQFHAATRWAAPSEPFSHFRGRTQTQSAAAALLRREDR